MQASLPPSENVRLAALHALEILDTEPEPSFDRLVSLVARTLHVPTSLISLVDHDRQWFKARCGVDVTQMPRSISFCAHAILGEEVMVVPDATLDPRFADNPLVTGEAHIRFYAGAPLVTPEGHHLGTLCVLDREARHMEEAERDSLRDFAAIVVDMMRHRNLDSDLARTNRKLRRALEESSQLARAIESLGTGVVMVDPNLPDEPVTFVNEAFVALTGYEIEDVLGRNCRFLQGPGTDQSEVARLREALGQRKPFHGKLLNYRKDGTPFWNALSVNAVSSEDGEIVNFVGLQIDVTAQHEAEELVRARAIQTLSLAQLGQSALEGASVADLLDAAVEATARGLAADLCRISEPLPAGGGLLIRAGVGWQPGIVSVARIPADAQTPANRAVETGQPSVDEHLCDDAHFVKSDFACQHGAVSGASVVIRGKAGTFGVLCVMSRKPRHFVPEDVDYLRGIAHVLSASIDRFHDEEALRRSDSRFQRITANVPGMVYQALTSPDGDGQDMTFVSDACRDIFGVEPEFICSHRGFIEARVHPEDLLAFTRSVAESTATLQTWRWQGRVILAGDGNSEPKEKWLQGVARPEREPDGTILWDGMLMDISESKRGEQLARDVEAAERANLAKSEFLSRMSHELRTPLNAILGFGQLLQMEAPPSEPAAEKKYTSAGAADYIVLAGRHLLKMIDEVLDLARIESGHTEILSESVPVDEIVGKSLDLVRPLAKAQNITLEWFPQGSDTETGGAGAVRVRVDPQRFKQVLINLVSNAVKYNCAGGKVSVGVGAGLEPECVRIRVADTGPGIAPELRHRLFTPFERLGAEFGAVEGTGLGLALSKKLIEAMGGKIGLEESGASGPAGGSVFWVEMPLAASPAPVAPAKDAVPPRAGWNAAGNLPAGRTMLYIEDNDSNLRLIERLMARFPQVQLLTAMHGASGLDLAKLHQPDLILLDVHLPDVPGWEVLARLKADAETRDIPVAIISADATEPQITRMLMAGACTYLTKPLDVQVFLEVVRQVFAGETLEQKSHRM